MKKGQQLIKFKTLEELQAVVNLYKEKGFTIFHDLDKEDEKPNFLGICIDFDKRQVFEVNPMCMLMTETHGQKIERY